MFRMRNWWGHRGLYGCKAAVSQQDRNPRRKREHQARTIRDFTQAIREDRDPLVNPASARVTSELIRAIYKSSREARTVELSEGRD